MSITNTLGRTVRSETVAELHERLRRDHGIVWDPATQKWVTATDDPGVSPVSRWDRFWPTMERKLTTAERTVARWWAIGGIFAVTGGLAFLPWH